MTTMISNAKFTIKDSSKRSPKVWWNEETDKFLRLKIAAQKSFNFVKSATNAEMLLQSEQNFKQAVLKAKRQSFASKIDQMNNSPNTKSFYKFMRGCKNFGTMNNHSKWNNENNLLFLNHLKDQVPFNSPTPFVYSVSQPIQDFSTDEFLSVLKSKTKPSSAGIDGITYDMVKTLSENSKMSLLSAFNNCWRLCEIRDSWRQIKIVPIPKKGKDLEIHTNIRPISLIPVFMKIINMMVKERLVAFLSEKNILPARTFAYRKHFSASTCINELLHTICTAKQQNQIVTVISLDISKAYDCVNIEKLSEIMSELDCPTHLTAWIINFLKKRTLVLGHESCEILNGLPQGSCLSPILFNMYTMGLHGIADTNTHVFQFADDFIIVSTHKNFECSTENLQKKIEEFVSITNNLNLQLNTQKTCAMYVAKGARKQIQISINNNLIKNVKSFKFLGRIIKNSLSINEHVNAVMKETLSATNAIKMVTPIKGGLRPNIAINLTKSLVFSKTEYVISSMAHMPKYINKKITSFQNLMLRKSLGLNPSTPVHNIYALIISHRQGALKTQNF